VKTASFTFLAPDYGEREFTSAAQIVSIPDDGVSSAAFGPFDLTIRLGDSAYIQISAIRERVQQSLLLSGIYDTRIVELKQARYGVRVSALSIGETAIQSITSKGVTTLAVVKVVE